jgi:sterol 3beta-glucosyltransferase
LQPFWPPRLHQLGVAPTRLPQRDLTADALAAAIRACLDEPAYGSRAATLADRIRVADSAAGVLAVVNSLFSR